MKTIAIPAKSTDIHAVLEEARKEDVILRTTDGLEFMLTAIEDFDQEIARTRQNEKLMALLDERAKQQGTVTLDAVKQALGLEK